MGKWEQTVKSANFLADDKYVYLVDCDDAPIYGGKVTAEGEMVFHAGITPKEDVTVTIIRMTTVSLDDQFVARLDGTNTTESFWEWWPVAGETTPDKYERLCRWAGIMAEAWKDKTYTVHGYGYGVSGDPELTPMDDLAALGKAALATDQDGDMYDWAEEDPMTWYIRGNALSRQDGTMDILALEGESEFDLSGGTAPVYTFSMALWVKKEIDETTWIKSWKTVRADGYRPYAGDVGFVDNRKRAITWHPSFSGSLLDNGALTSGADRPAYLFRSSIAGIEAARKMTKYEGLWGDTDTNWLSDMWQLRHQNKGTTGVLSGCCDYDHQYQVAMAEENVRRVLLRPEQADDLIVGSTVSLGDNDSGSEYHDRNNTDMRDLADLVKIVSITDVHVNDTAYKAVALDIPADINVPDTAWISTMPWHSGSTEGVPGHKDGCLGGLTNKTYPVRIAGIEIFNGAYICGLDPLYTCVANETSGFDYAVYECRDSEKQACPSYTTIPDNYADTGITLHAVRSGWNSVKEYAPNDRDIVFPLSLGGSATTFYKSSFDGSYNSYIKAAHRFCTLTGGSLMNLLSQSTYRSPDIVDFQHSVSLGGSGKKRGIWKE